MLEPTYTAEEIGERRALLAVRTFIANHGAKEVDAFCVQRLHDIKMDRHHWDQASRKEGTRA